MKIHKLVIMALFVAATYSCSASDRESGKKFVYNINIDNAKRLEEFLPLSDFCDNATTIILETTKESLLSRIEKVVLANDRLYVFDSTYGGVGTVAEFDMDGKFVRRFGSVGRGPGEYVGISEFAIDEQNGFMHLFDRRTGRLISYDLDSGKYVSDMRMDQNNSRINAIVSVGDLIYTDLVYWNYDKSNYLLKSWNIDDPETGNYYLPIEKHLKGWTNTTLANNGNFIFHVGNDYSLFSNRFSPEIYKLNDSGIDNYLYVESKDFIDVKGRQKVSSAIESDNSGGSGSLNSYHQTIQNLDCFYGIRDYFETDKYICFYVMRGTTLHNFIYDKNNGEVKAGYFNNDLVVTVKSDYSHLSVQSLLLPMQADDEGLLYSVWSRDIDKLRTAAREGLLAENLDRLEEIKQLPDDANPVIFYMKFKEPMK